MADSVRLIKKYPNRRLYDTRTSSYITLADVKQLVLRREALKVIDAKTGEDLSRSILLQILVEEETGQHPSFTPEMLSELIRSRAGTMQAAIGAFLQRSLEAVLALEQRLQADAPMQQAGAGSKNVDDLVAAHSALMQQLVESTGNAPQPAFSSLNLPSANLQHEASVKGF